MRKLTVRNIGPVQSIDIDLNKVNVFIGSQSSGKSTIAKIISFCTWLEKMKDATEKVVARGVIDRLEEYHRMNGYFNATSSLQYIGDNVAFAYNCEFDDLPQRFVEAGGEHLKENELFYSVLDKTVNPKVIYIPSDRNFVSSVKNIRKYSEGDDSLQSFVNDWDEARHYFDESKPLDIKYLGQKYFYSEKNDKDFLLLDENKRVTLQSSSSGIQSIIPIEVLVHWCASGIYEDNKPFTPEENERIRNIITHLSEKTEREQQKELIERLSGFIKGKIYTHTQFIIEEPEQNLFPTTQRDFLYSLLGEINHGRNHHLVLTTHSPYIISYLSLAVKAASVSAKTKKIELLSRINEIIPRGAQLSSSDLAIYELSESGEISILKAEHGIPSDDNYLNNALGDANEMYDRLMDIEEEIECGK